ncbi:ABC transporter ATP-binding protein [Caldovatus sediminis]|uniref:ABC transporter ATP-binding protein n=1 Tax=Caldovatus sediminis TaxID=2041189 RepID=A0A8J2Z8I8_9PROT|nr:ABC transporter ATP-binding protein [Caldovatus sediminis]GGG19507.1 ABC transporter ATP-binding protein [Caldovatus sediminis]
MLEVEHLAVSYGPTRILEDVSFAVPEGQVVSLLGGNGSGKTTVLNALCGMVRPDGGSARIAGEDCTGRRPDEILRRGVAQVPQGREVFATMTVAENLEMGAYARRDRDGVRRDTERVLALFPRLREKARRRAGTLSGGEQQMLAVARAMMSGPRLLLMDEPSVGLAPAVLGDMVATIRALRAEGMTILLVEQNVGVAAAVADTAHVLRGGRIVHSGPAARLLGDEEVLRSYLG